MNYYVPDLETEEDASIPSSSGFRHHKKTAMQEDEPVELPWLNGQVVMQSHRSQKKYSPARFPVVHDAVLPGFAENSAVVGDLIGSGPSTENQLFIQEDEMASWLHCPLDDFCTDDLLDPAPTGNYAPAARTSQIPKDRKPEEKYTPTALHAPMPPERQPEAGHAASAASEPKVVNFSHFSRQKGTGEADLLPSVCDKAGKESTVVDSSETPARFGQASNFRGSVGDKAATVSGGNLGSWGRTCGFDMDRGTCEATVTSSSGVSGASAGRFLKPPASDDRKRKVREADEYECQSEDAEYESVDEKKAARRSTSARKTRASEVHNLSERRRRDRINEKMKALQELIPRCNKADKASMLDEAIEYLKSLQLQVQMMSMGCSMAPTMFPGVQHYMPPMGMGVGMGMGIGMGMRMEMPGPPGLNGPMMPFPPVFGCTSIPGPAVTHIGQSLPMPAFSLPHLPPSDQGRPQGISHLDSSFNSVGWPGPSSLQNPNFVDSYQHYLGLLHMQMSPQNQAMPQPSASRGTESPENQQSAG